MPCNHVAKVLSVPLISAHPLPIGTFFGPGELLLIRFRCHGFCFIRQNVKELIQLCHVNAKPDFVFPIVYVHQLFVEPVALQSPLLILPDLSPVDTGI